MPPAKLYREMTAYLEAMIASGGFAPDSRLPSQRDLCAQFDLTKGTVARGLEELQARGIITLRRGAGAFVARRNGRSGKDQHYEIAILTEGRQPENSYCAQVMVGAQWQAAQRNCGLNIQFVRYRELDPVRLQAHAEKFDGVLLLGNYDNNITRLPDTRPIVAVNMHRAFGIASLIDLDPVLAAHLAVDYFQTRGIREIIGWRTVHPDYPVGDDVFAFRWAQFAAQSPWPARQFVLPNAEFPARLESCAPGTGLLFASGSTCESCCRAYFEATGRQLPDDYPCLSIDGKSLINRDYTPVDTIGPDYQLMGRIALDECLRRIENPGTPLLRIYQDVRLHRR